MLAQYLTAVNSLLFLTINQKKYRHLSCLPSNTYIKPSWYRESEALKIHITYVHRHMHAHNHKVEPANSTMFKQHRKIWLRIRMCVCDDVTLKTVVVARTNLKKVTQGDRKASNEKRDSHFFFVLSFWK